MKRSAFTGVILAGGASRRMGTDKCKMQLGGKPMLAIMRQKLLDAGARKIVVLGLANEDGGIADQNPGQGPVVAAVHYLAEQPLGSKHLFVPVDMPGLDAGLLEILACQNYWARFGTYNFPFLAVADGIKLTPPKRLYDLLVIKMARHLTATEINETSFVNLNSPDDYATFVGSAPRSGVRTIMAERTS